MQLAVVLLVSVGIISLANLRKSTPVPWRLVDRFDPDQGKRLSCLLAMHDGTLRLSFYTRRAENQYGARLKKSYLGDRIRFEKNYGSVYQMATGKSTPVRMISLALPLGLVGGVLLLFGSMGQFFLVRHWYIRHRIRRRILSGLCPTCGYNLSENVSGLCPECGTPIQTNTSSNDASERAFQ